MDIAKKKLIIMLMSTTLSLWASQPPFNQKASLGKVIDCIGQSYIVCWLNKKIQSYINNKPLIEIIDLINGPVTPRYQALGKEVQYALEIPEHHHIPVKRTHPISMVYWPDTLYIDEKKLNNLPYGVSRCILYHDSIHNKYNDPLIKLIINWTTLFGSSYATHKTLHIINHSKKPKIAHMIGVITVGFITSFIINLNHNCYTARRTEIESYHAIACSTCIEEMNTHKHLYREQSRHSLSPDETYTIIDYLKQKNKLCTYHKNNR